MAAAWRHKDRADALTSHFVGKWSEEKARAKFVEYRWAAHGGLPTCPKCGCDAVWSFKARPIYKCKKCDKQFSDKSGTPWAYSKLTFSELVRLIAYMADERQAITAKAVCERMKISYKTALLWFHRMRAEIKRYAETQELSGEVEIDGAYFGGYVRPKNVKKTQKDLRKIPYRANDRAVAVVAARQRGGGIRTWIAKEETHARPFIADAVKQGSTLFSDKAPGWKPLRGKFKLFQIDHSKAYYTPEACTNGVETLWALMRVAGRVHRRIAHNYLDLYAAQAAWNLQKSKKTEGQAFVELMTWMSRPGKSPLVGYLQGRKRQLPVCKPNGKVENWTYPTKRARIDYIRNGVEPILYKPRRPLQKTWREDFDYLSAEAFLNDPSTVPDGPGVYAVFLKNGRCLLQASGFIEHQSTPFWHHQGADHVYTGETYGLRTRLYDHLVGDIRASTLRESLLALQFNLDDSFREEAGPTIEKNLSDWLRANAVIGFKSCGYVQDVERVILDATASPLNVSRANSTNYARLLLDLRRRFRTEVSDSWPKAPSRRHPVRR